MCCQLVKAVLKVCFVPAIGEVGGGGRGFQYRVAALAGYRTVLVSTGWIISQHVSTNGHKNQKRSGHEPA